MLADFGRTLISLLVKTFWCFSRLKYREPQETSLAELVADFVCFALCFGHFVLLVVTVA
jgi:hypothetical protein